MAKMYIEPEERKEILAAVPIEKVIERVGLAVDYRKNSILCPFHNDKHFGSCVINKKRNTCWCFVCQRSINAIDLLCELEGLSVYDAICELAEMAGMSERFSQKEKPKRKLPPALSDKEKQLLGFARFSKAYPVIGVSVEPVNQSKRIRDDEGNYLILEDGVANEWSSLMKESPEAYKEMVINKCNEKIASLDLMHLGLQAGVYTPSMEDTLQFLDIWELNLMLLLIRRQVSEIKTRFSK